MIRTRVGYTGGTLKDPTYHRLGDHTESIQIDFDPAKIAYARLLEEFWASNPCGAAGSSRQYRSAIFYHSPEQRKAASESLQRQITARGKVHTDVEALKVFYAAEDYHQKYALRGTGELMREFDAMYPNPVEFRNSTAAARVNGYLDGHGHRKQLDAELPKLGLSADAGRWLRERVASD